MNICPLISETSVSTADRIKLNNAFEFFKKELGISKYKISFKIGTTSKPGRYAEVFYTQKNQDFTFRIVVSDSSTLSLDHKIKHLAHETIHIYQMVNGLLDSENKAWMGKKVDSNLEYNKLPWEIDARIKADKLWILFNKSLIKETNVEEGVTLRNFDGEIQKLEDEWDRLDSQGTGLERQSQIRDQLIKLRKEKLKWEKLYSSINPINEVRILHSKKIWNEPPLKDSDTIRVYHGFYNIMDSIVIALHGMSGQEYAHRVYSYEAVNNPHGLFVSIELDIAKKFSSSGVVIEFDTKVSNLEAPIWHGGRGFFGQGEYTSGFNNSSERESQRVANRDKFKNDPDKRISQSDRPELAHTLFGAEYQALFIGHLNPNMIKAFWVCDNTIYQRLQGPYTRVSRNEFLRIYGYPYIKKLKDENDREVKDRGHYVHNDWLSKLGSLKGKLLKPNDDFNFQKASDVLTKEYNDKDLSNVLRIEIEKAQKGDRNSLHTMQIMFWPKQLKQLNIIDK